MARPRPWLVAALVLCGGCEWGTLGGDPGDVDAPTGVTVGAISSTQLVVSWTDRSTNEDGFTVERAPDQSGAAGVYAIVGQTAASVTNYSDSGLTEATKYWYRVYATSPSLGDSAKSSPASGSTRLAEPLNMHMAALSATSVELTWTDASSNSSLPSAGTYWYRLNAYAAVYEDSNYTSYQSVTTP